MTVKRKRKTAKNQGAEALLMVFITGDDKDGIRKKVERLVERMEVTCGVQVVLFQHNPNGYAVGVMLDREVAGAAVQTSLLLGGKG